MSADAKFYCPKCQNTKLIAEGKLLKADIDYWVENDDEFVIEIRFDCFYGCGYKFKIKHRDKLK